MKFLEQSETCMDGGGQSLMGICKRGEGIKDGGGVLLDSSRNGQKSAASLLHSL